MGSELYQEAARIVKDALAGKGRIKTLVYGSRFKDKKSLMAVSDATFRSYPQLEAALIKYGVPGRGPIHAVILGELARGRHVEACSVLWPDMPSASVARELLGPSWNLSKPEDAAARPRYARVNTIMASVSEVFAALKKEFKDILIDPIVPQLLVFPPGTVLSRHPLYLDGTIVLQDRASCLPVLALAPPPGSSVVDSCAAPGNKTTQLAATVGPSGRVIAFERDPRRFRILTRSISKHGCSNIVTPYCGDFLAAAVDPSNQDLRDCKFALVDPSCSCSGIEGISGQCPTERAQRLESLHRFQCSILKKALSLPLMQRVAYSTCSTHAEENELVVQEVLASPEGSRFRIAKNILPAWPRRGLPQFPFANDVLRADPLLDNTDGFFVAVFERF